MIERSNGPHPARRPEVCHLGPYLDFSQIGAGLLVVLMAATVSAWQDPAPLFRPGAKVFVAQMPDGFDTYFKAALEKKKVPLIVVPTQAEADFAIKGTSETQKAGAAKKVFMLNWHSDEQASISVTSVASGEVVFAYSANKKSSARGKRTSAEACAKNLKNYLDKKR
jgi:hypothetical protein